MAVLDQERDDDTGELTKTVFDISSECIASLAYDHVLQRAEFMFHKDGFKVFYTEMSFQECTAWANSGSVGAYFNANIKGRA